MSEVRKPLTKNQFLIDLATSTGLTRKEVGSVFEALPELVRREIGKRGTGVLIIPGLMKIQKVQKPATKARKGRNPLTGEEMMFKAKPARNAVKVRPLKALKEMVS